jgi:hypothetical protein
MGNYAVTDWVSQVDTPKNVAAAIETYMETLDSSKTLYVTSVIQRGNGKCQAIIIHLA